MLFPVIDIDIGDAANEKFELPFVKDIDKIGRNELVEPGDERIELLIHTLLNLPYGHEPKDA